MTRFADGPVVEVSVSINAPLAMVWDLVSDINLPTRFQSEFVGAEWLDDGPTLNARFVGRNLRGDRTWETTSWLVSYEPMKVFGWAVNDRDEPGATWTYFLHESDTTTTLRFHRKLGPGESGVTYLIAKDPEHEEEIIAARDEQHRRSMQAVTDGIRDIAENQ